MKESTRQFYLASMGISMWYARESLPGAAASPEMDFSVSASEPLPQVQPAQQMPAAPRAQVSGKKGLQEVRQALGQDASAADASSAGQSSEEPAAAPVSEPVTDVHDQAQDSGESVRVQAVVCAGNRLNLVAEYGQDMTRELQLRLVGNLLRALGESDVEPQLLQWPVFRNPRVPGNDREGLDRVLSGLLSEMGDRPWLILGKGGVESMAAYLEARESRVWLKHSASLQSLAADPEMKRDLWHQLQARLKEAPLESPGP